MPNTTSSDKERGLRYLKFNERMAVYGFTFMDVKGDDTDGRITGACRCYFCGMRYNDQEQSESCCRPLFARAGLLERQD